MKKILVSVLVSVLTMTFSAVDLGASSEMVYVLSLAGEVKVTPAGWDKAVSCKPGMRLKEGTRIKTGEESYIELAFDKRGKNIVKIKEDSDVLLKLDGAEKIELINGEIFTLLKNLKKGEKFKVKTPSAVCAVRGTGWNTKTDGEFTDVSVFLDNVSVRGINKDGSVMEKEYSVNEGFERRIKRFQDPGKAARISESRLKSMRGEMKLPKVVSPQVKKIKKTASSRSGAPVIQRKKLGDITKLDDLKVEKLDKLRDRRGGIHKRLDRKDRLSEDQEGGIIDRRERLRINRIRKDQETRLSRGDNILMNRKNQFVVR